MRLIKGLIAAAIAAALLLVPAGALAKGRDRDHDRMPDKWEKRHHLNVRANDARKDPDRDRLSNLSEFRHHTDPQRADTDDDDIDDGNEIREGSDPDDPDEISGTVVSFAGNVLTLQLPGDGAGTVSGTVNDATEIECDDEDGAPVATASDDGSDDDNSGPGSGGDDRSGDDNSGPGSTPSGPGPDGDGENRDDDNDDDANEDRCTTASLTQGTRVHEAKLVKADDGSMVFTKIELVPAA
jgi:hypothetical protein